MKIYINRFNLFFIITYFIWTLYLYLIYFASNYIKGGNFRNGFKLGNDSPRYIDAAKDILQFNIPEGKALSYLSYDLIVAIALLFRDNLLDVVIFQIILTAISAFCLYKITKTLFDTSIGIISFSIFLFYPDIQIRNFYILTESLIISIPIISIYLIINKKKYIAFLGYSLLLFSCFIRPHAIVIFPVLMLLLYFDFKNSGSKLLINLFYITNIIFIPIIFIIANYLLTKEGALLRLISGQIIGEYEGLKIDGVPKLYDNKFENLNEIIFIIFKYPIFFIKVFLMKFFWFFARIRPYYSDFHNLIIIITTLPIYITFVFGLFTKTNNHKLKISLLFFIFLITISVCMIQVDWSGRFLLPIIPIIIIFSSSGFLYLYKTFQKIIHSN